MDDSTGREALESALRGGHFLLGLLSAHFLKTLNLKFCPLDVENSRWAAS